VNESAKRTAMILTFATRQRFSGDGGEIPSPVRFNLDVNAIDDVKARSGRTLRQRRQLVVAINATIRCGIV